ncbi:MAG: hypothetical protein AAF483_22870 [Planctomycetota bacterium]
MIHLGDTNWQTNAIGSAKGATFEAMITLEARICRKFLAKNFGPRMATIHRDCRSDRYIAVCRQMTGQSVTGLTDKLTQYRVYDVD